MPELPEDEQRKVRDAAEDYQSTVHAMLAFSAFVVHDAKSKRPNSHFNFGRRMTTSEANVITASSNTVTPDIVAQKSGSYGMVAEVKRSLALDRTTWPAHIEQVRKYDDDLTGWWTPNEQIATSDTTLLVHQSRSRAFINVLEEAHRNNTKAVGPHTSVIEFNRSIESQQNYFFRLEWGGIRDVELSDRLREGVPVPIDKVIRTFANVKFYDAEPPLASLLALLWIDYFPPLAEGLTKDENLKAIPIDVNAANIAPELQKAYGSGTMDKDARSVEFPTIQTIRKALEALVSVKLAMALPGGAGAYRVLYRQFNDDILLRFAAMLRTPPEQVIAQAELPFLENYLVAEALADDTGTQPRIPANEAAGTSRKAKKKPVK